MKPFQAISFLKIFSSGKEISSKEPYSLTEAVEDQTCPDLDLYDQCFTECRLVYLDCLAACDSNTCDDQCRHGFDDCGNSCPCGQNCPSGCNRCNHPLCPDRAHFLVFNYDINEAFIIGESGATSNPQPTIGAPTNDFTKNSVFALLRGELHIFGGSSDENKIAKLDGCEFVELNTRMGFNVSYESAALAIEEESKVLICFEDDETYPPSQILGTICEIYDGVEISSSYSTNFTHILGKLGFYNGRPTTVGSTGKDGYRKTETLGSDGWFSLPDHPKTIYGHTLTGLSTGELVLASGYNLDTYTWTKQAWILKDDVWSSLDDLQKSVYRGSAILAGSSIFIFAGYGQYYDYSIQRVDFDGSVITGNEVIGKQTDNFAVPVLFQTSFDYCVSY